VREETGRPGHTDDALGALEWRGKDQFGNVFIRIDRRSGSTRITAGADRTETALVAWIVSPIAGLVAAGAAAGALGVELALAVVLGLGGGLGAGRFLWQRVAARWRARIQSLLDRLTTAAPTPGD